MKYKFFFIKCLQVIILFFMFISCNHKNFKKEIVLNGKFKHEVSYKDSLISQYGLFEINICLSSELKIINPYDTSEIEIYAIINFPNGDIVKVNAFYFQDYTRSLVNNIEQLDKKGDPYWKIRYTPTNLGRYFFKIIVKHKYEKAESKIFHFKVIQSNGLGFIRRKNNRYHLKYDSNKEYFAIGESVAWVKKDRITYDYDYFFNKLAENNCNYSRIWLVEWNIPLEWTKNESTNGDAYGLGKYSLENSWRLDYIINLAKEKGLHLLLTIGTYGDLKTEKGDWGENRWQVNPYNIKNGGYCSTPEEFWTNKESRIFYKQKLKYLLDRWGYSPNILAFELWNEVDSPVEWTKEMSNYIKHYDLNKHLITTSVGYSTQLKLQEDRTKVWQLENIDYTQTHLYGSKENIANLGLAVHDDCLLKTSQYKKPHLVAEFGIDYLHDDMVYDSVGKGIQIHNVLWSSLMSRSFGVGMTHWKEYIDQKNLYYNFKNISNFVNAIDFDSRDLNDSIEFKKLINYNYAPVNIIPDGYWGEKPLGKNVIGDFGQTSTKVIQYIYSSSKNKDACFFIPEFMVDFPVNGEFIISVDQVSQNADIHFYLDNKEIWGRKFSSEKDDKDWFERKYNEKYKTFTAFYNKSYRIKIPSGKHNIRIENHGVDWLKIKQLTLTNYSPCKYHLKVMGLKNKNSAICWVHNLNNNWFNHHYGGYIGEFSNVSFDIINFEKGDYVIQYWDTFKGKVICSKIEQCNKGIIKLKIDRIKDDIALIIKRIK